MGSRRKITNPKTGRKVYATGTIGRKILSRKKSAKKSGKKKKKPSRKSGKGFCTRRKSAKTCGSEPNCSWRKKSKTCVRQKGVRKGSVYEGPKRKGDY